MDPVLQKTITSHPNRAEHSAEEFAKLQEAGRIAEQAIVEKGGDVRGWRPTEAQGMWMRGDYVYKGTQYQVRVSCGGVMNFEGSVKCPVSGDVIDDLEKARTAFNYYHITNPPPF